MAAAAAAPLGARGGGGERWRLTQREALAFRWGASRPALALALPAACPPPPRVRGRQECKRGSLQESWLPAG